MASFKVITDVKRFAPAKDVPSFYGFYRAHELHKEDVLYCNIKFMEEQRYYYELLLGQTIYFHTKDNNIREEGIAARVTKVFKEKKYPNKKWWQFWLKQEETVTGYHLMVV